ASGLRDGQKKLIAELQPPAVNGGDVRGGGRDRDAKMTLDQVLAEGRRVGRAAAGTGDHDMNRFAPEEADQFRDVTRHASRLPPQDLRRLADFNLHDSPKLAQVRLPYDSAGRSGHRRSGRGSRQL